MATQLLYLTDSYLSKFDGLVLKMEGDLGYFDRTVFYPRGGGQPSDIGYVSDGVQRVRVLEVFWKDGEVAHRLERPLGEGVKISGEVDWNLRYAHMRHHTAVHILSGVMFRDYSAPITGGQIYHDRARVDFDLEEITKEMVYEIEEKCNRVVQERRTVRARIVPQSVALEIPELVRTKTGRKLVEQLSEVRLVEIEGFDVQTDGGTHVANTGEVGKISVVGVENKGKHNKRFEIVLGPPL
jgi:misacylated tRNA(Ala) deacylase